ncbi:UNVERIFIED_CONTAM: ATP-citrate synthase alpha chain protein 1 [Sesamum radiatum]|uniref:ATP-citrate synthase alpha chain protein 1 n=1 Tax=Sesamum radiatum TaxID=300843 RepID=A0AAW2TVJ1_SESRA
MARKKIREYDSKRLLKEHFKRISGSELEIKSAQVEMGGCRGPITTFIVEPFVPHNEEFYLNIVSDRLGCSISFSECGGIEIEENWDKIKGVIEEFIKAVYALFLDLDFTFLEMNPFTLVDGKPYPLDMRGELDDTAAFKNFKKWGNIEFPMPFGRVMSPTESFIHGLDEKVGDLGYASELGNYAEYSGAPNEEEVLQYARVVIDEAKLKAARMHLYVRRGGPNYQKGLARMRTLAEEIGIPIEVYGPEATMTGICKQAIECISAAA